MRAHVVLGKRDGAACGGHLLSAKVRRRVHADSAMPDLGVSERDARDMAAYLSALK